MFSDSVSQRYISVLELNVLMYCIQMNDPHFFTVHTYKYKIERFRVKLYILQKKIYNVNTTFTSEQTIDNICSVFDIS